MPAFLLVLVGVVSAVALFLAGWVARSAMYILERRMRGGE